MGFKENLLKKIHIDALAQKVIASIGPAGSGQRIDKETMIRLLETGPFRKIQERDLDLYILEGDAGGGRILVLDNDLAVYHTSAADIALRKSPYIKEMVSIRNIKKILNDTDVVESKKEASIQTIQQLCIDRLDLSYAASDIDQLAKEGAAALETGNEGGIRESVDLFSELLGFVPAPKPLRLDRFEMLGEQTEGANGEQIFGPGIVFDPIHNTLKWIEDPIGSFDKEAIQRLHRIAKGDEPAAAEGAAIFQILKEAVLKRRD